MYVRTYIGLPNPQEGGRERAIAYVTCSTGGKSVCLARAHTHTHTHTRDFLPHVGPNTTDIVQI